MNGRGALPVLLLALGLAAPLACAPAGVRRATYPIAFQYLDGSEVRGGMRRLAHATVRLDALLRTSTGAPERAAVLAELDAMVAAAAALDITDVSNHPLLDANLDRFRADLATARAAATGEPPNYFLAGALGGSCAYCHGRDEAR
jgi:hypothetical protein